MGDGEGGQAVAHALDDGLDLGLGLGVDVGGGLVQEQHGGLQVEHAGEGQELPLASAELLAPLAHLGLQALGQPRHQVLQLALLQHRGQPALVEGPVQHDVVAQGAGEDEDILEHQPEEVAQAAELELPDIHTVHGDAALVHVVEAHEQVDERALAGAGVAHHGHAAALGDDAAQVADHLPAALLVGEGDALQAHLGSEGGGLRIGRFRNLILVVQQPEDALAGGQGRLHHVVTLRQFPDGPEEPPRLLDEGQQQAPGDGPGLELEARVEDEGRQGAGGDELHHGEEHGVGEDGAQEGLEVVLVQALELGIAARLLGIHLHQAHAGDLLLEEGVDAGVAALGLPEGLARPAAEDLRGDEQEGQDAQGHQGHAGVGPEHPGHDGQQGEGVPHDGHEARGEHLVEVLHVAGDPRHESAHGIAVEEVRAPAHQVLEELHSQVEHGLLAHPGQQEVAREADDEPCDEHPEEPGDHGGRALQAALVHEAVDEPERELRGHDLQEGAQGHQEQQGQEGGPLGAQVAGQAPEQRVAHGPLVQPVGLKVGFLFGHGAILPQAPPFPPWPGRIGAAPVK